MASPYAKKDPSAPFAKGVAVAPNDATVLPQTDALFIGGAGNLTVTMQDGNDLVLTGVPVGVIHLAVTKVKAATTATNIAALYKNF